MLQPKNKTIEKLVFLVSVSVLLLNHAVAYTGHYGYDDLHYAKLANELMHGRMDFSDHYSFRWPILVLTALSFKIFGINDFAAAIPSLIVNILTLYLVYLIVRPYGFKALIFALGITVLDGWSLHYSDKIMPDTYINLAVMLMLYFIYKNKFSSVGNNTIGYALSFAGSFLFGFMAKESILLIAPLLAYLVVADLVLKRDTRFWKYSILFTILLFVLYFGFISYLTGSPGQRFIAIQQNPYLSLCSYDQQSLIILFKRISYQFFALLINKGMFIAPGITLLFLFIYWRKEILLYKDEYRFFGISLLLLLLSGNFMTASMTSYNPLCLDPRHYMFLVPIASISASVILSDQLNSFRNNLLIVVLLLFFSIVSYLHSRHEFQYLYLPMLLLFSLHTAFFRSKKFNLIFPYAFILVLSLKLIDKIRFTNELDYEGQKKVVMNHFISSHSDSYVITDDVQKRLGDYYNSFGMKSETRFLKFDSFLFDTLDKTREKYVLLNNYTQQLSNLNAWDLPYYALSNDTSAMVYSNEALHLRIIKLNQIVEPVELLRYENGFENEEDSSDYGVSISNQKMYRGDKSNKIDEFSYTFKYALDSIQLKLKQRILIQLKFVFWKDHPSKANIVVSLEEKESPYFYETQSCDHYVRVFSNWNHGRMSRILESEKIKPGSLLKIYIWNQDKTEMYMDDFSVKLFLIQ